MLCIHLCDCHVYFTKLSDISYDITLFLWFILFNITVWNISRKYLGIYGYRLYGSQQNYYYVYLCIYFYCINSIRTYKIHDRNEIKAYNIITRSSYRYTYRVYVHVCSVYIMYGTLLNMNVNVEQRRVSFAWMGFYNKKTKMCMGITDN